MSSRANPPGSEGNIRTRRLNLTLESRVESAELAESRIVEFSERAGYGERQCGEIGLAVREAVINAVLHGNRCDMNKKVVLTAELRGPELVICVRDEGEGFDPDRLADPLVPDNLLHESGRGFFLVKTCMDDVVVRKAANNGAELTMIKYLSKTILRRTTK
jgi:serine/threonine-protein kinase RsbW